MEQESRMSELAYWKKFRSECDPPQPEHIKCSNCGQYWAISEHAKIFKYCFNCGAKMTGEQNDRRRKSIDNC